MTEAVEPKADTHKKPRAGRSPAYPSLTIEEAIKKATDLFNKEGKYPAPMPSAFTAWGYGAKSSGARVVRASLKYFGLITVEGDGDNGKVKLTEDALRVILDAREDQSEKKAIIKRLAMVPAIHQTLKAEFPDGIKSDATVVHYLMFEQGYNQAAANEVIAEFKATATFADVFKPDTVSVKSDPKVGNEDQQEDEIPEHGAGETPPPASITPTPPKGSQVKVMDGERIVFTEEGTPNQYLKLVASGEVDDVLLEALEDFVKRQRKRLKIVAPAKESDGPVTLPTA